MIITILMIASVFLFIVAPIISLGKYYHPSRLSVPKNIFWVIVTILTFPLVPFILAARRRDVFLVGIFSFTFGLWIAAFIAYFSLAISLFANGMVIK